MRNTWQGQDISPFPLSGCSPCSPTPLVAAPIHSVLAPEAGVVAGAGAEPWPCCRRRAGGVAPTPR